jgi:RNA polymerase sigma-70 factor, ECF subfamily
MKNNRDMLASLYEAYYDRIAHYIYSHIGDKTEAEDLASEVFLKAVESLKTYQERGLPMQAWLFKIAHNLMVDRLRKASKYRMLPIETVEIKEETDPVETAELNLEMERVTAAMENLTAEQREVVKLRFLGGLTSKEVSEILNKNDGAVREMQRAALEKLRQLLGGNKPSG